MFGRKRRKCTRFFCRNWPSFILCIVYYPMRSSSSFRLSITKSPLNVRLIVADARAASRFGGPRRGDANERLFSGALAFAIELSPTTKVWRICELFQCGMDFITGRWSEAKGSNNDENGFDLLNAARDAHRDRHSLAGQEANSIYSSGEGNSGGAESPSEQSSEDDTKQRERNSSVLRECHRVVVEHLVNDIDEQTVSIIS